MKLTTRLKASLIFGWTLVGAVFLSIPLSSIVNEGIFAPLFYFASILLTIRYSMIKPIIRAGSAGFATVGFAYVLEKFFRRDHSISVGLFIGMLFYIVFILIKNFFVSIYLLILETIYYMDIRKEGQQVHVENQVAAATYTETLYNTPQLDGPPLIQQKILDEGVPEIITTIHMKKYFNHIDFANIAYEYYRGNNDAYFMWNWYGKSSKDPFMSNNKIIMIGGKEKKRDEFITNFCKSKFTADDLSVFRVTLGNNVNNGEEQWLGGVLRDTELLPGGQLVSEELTKQDPDFKEFKDVTLHARQFFADTYFHLLADLKGVSFEQLFPNGVRFDPEAASPLVGFGDSIEQSPYKDLLVQHISDFGTKNWTKTESGFIRNISDNLSPKEKALLLFETIWEMYIIPGYFTSLNHPHYFVFHVDIPNEVMPTVYHQEAFRNALEYLIYRSEWKNYHMSIIATIDEPNRFLTLPFNQQVLFNSKHIGLYKEMTNITINPKQSQVLSNVEPGTCCWIDHTQNLALGLRLRFDEKIDFINTENTKVTTSD